MDVLSVVGRGSCWLWEFRRGVEGLEGETTEESGECCEDAIVRYVRMQKENEWAEKAVRTAYGLLNYVLVGNIKRMYGRRIPALVDTRSEGEDVDQKQEIQRKRLCVLSAQEKKHSTAVTTANHYFPNMA